MDGPHCICAQEIGKLRIYVNYRSLNKQTARDSYPLPLPDEVQDCLTSAAVFSTLDLYSGYWQLPVAEADQPKTAFCPEPGMGLYQFCHNYAVWALRGTAIFPETNGHCFMGATICINVSGWHTGVFP